MTITTNHAMQQALRQLIANDIHAMTFQNVAQYRTDLLKHIDYLLDGTQPYTTSGIAVEGLHFVAGDVQLLTVLAGQHVKDTAQISQIVGGMESLEAL